MQSATPFSIVSFDSELNRGGCGHTVRANAMMDGRTRLLKSHVPIFFVCGFRMCVTYARCVKWKGKEWVQRPAWVQPYLNLLTVIINTAGILGEAWEDLPR